MRDSKKESYARVKTTILDTAQIQKHVELLADGAADAYLCSRSSQQHKYKIPLNFLSQVDLKTGWKLLVFSGYRVRKHRGHIRLQRRRINLLSSSPAEKDVGVMMGVKLIMSQQCAFITSGENCILGYIDMQSAKWEKSLCLYSEMVRLHLKYWGP